MSSMDKKPTRTHSGFNDKAPAPPEQMEPALSYKKADALAWGLLGITSQISREPNIDPLVFFPYVLKIISQALKVKQLGLHLLDDQLKQLHLIEQMGAGGGWQIVRLQDASPLVSCLQSGQPEFGAISGLGQVLAAPIVGVDLPVGSVSIVLPGELDDEPKEQWRTFMATAGYLLGIALEHTGLINELLKQLESVHSMQRLEYERACSLEDQNKDLLQTNVHLQHLIITDPLTGLVNRRHVVEVVNREIERSKRSGSPFCLCVLDVDRFKAINDNLGHQTGDQALVLLADLLIGGVRRVDVVGRFGGEEFVIILANCELKMGVNVAEHLRAKVEKESVTGPFAVRGGFTVSIGVAQYQEDMSMEQLLSMADAAMYRAKEAGRNRVEAAPLSNYEFHFSYASLKEC